MLKRFADRDQTKCSSQNSNFKLRQTVMNMAQLYHLNYTTKHYQQQNTQKILQITLDLKVTFSQYTDITITKAINCESADLYEMG